MNLRVIQRRDIDGDPWYTVEDVLDPPRGPGYYPLVNHEHGVLVGSSIKELREQLKAIEKALKKPVLELTPAYSYLKEVKK